MLLHTARFPLYNDPVSSWLDLLPSHERQKLRELRRRSPEEYAKLREKVKSVEQIGEEMARNEKMAELAFALESEPKIKEALKKQIERDVLSQGVDAMVEGSLSESFKEALQRGAFDVRIDSDPQTHVDQLVVVPEGNAKEVLVVSSSVSDRYVTQFAQAMGDVGQGA